MTTPPVVKAVAKNHQREQEGYEGFEVVLMVDALGWGKGNSEEFQSVELMKIKMYQANKSVNHHDVWTFIKDSRQTQGKDAIERLF